MDEKDLGEQGNYLNLLIHEKKFDCRKLFEDSIHDEPAPYFQILPYKNIPVTLLNDFTYGNKIIIKRYFFTQDFPRDRKKGKSRKVGMKRFYIKRSSIFYTLYLKMIGIMNF